MVASGWFLLCPFCQTTVAAVRELLSGDGCRCTRWTPCGSLGVQVGWVVVSRDVRGSVPVTF